MSQQIATAPPAAPVRPRAWFHSGRFLLFLAALLLIYGYGWRVTHINLPELVKGATFVRPFVRDLMRPDVLTRRMEIQESQVAVSIDPAVQPEAFSPPPGPTITPESRVTPVGSQLTVRGSGFQPNAQGRLFWVNPIGNPSQVALIRTDANGAFTETVTVPDVFRGPEAGPRGAQQRILVRVEWPVGALRFSNTAAIVFQKIIETVFLALMGTTIAVLAGVPLSFLGARNLMARNPLGTTIYYVTRTFFNIMRSIEPLILAIVFTVWVGLGPFAGVLALGLHSIAALGKLYSEQIESIDPGPIEAITATGASPLQVVRYAVVPQIVPPFIAFTIYRWDTNVRMSTVIGFVGGGGVGFILQQYINLLQYRQAATAVWAITLVVAAMDYFSAVVREKVV
jgi:phosphonate transport system permease protein